METQKTLCRAYLHSARSSSSRTTAEPTTTHASLTLAGSRCMPYTICCGAAIWPLYRWFRHLCRRMGAGNTHTLPLFVVSKIIIAPNGTNGKRKIPPAFYRRTLPADCTWQKIPPAGLGLFLRQPHQSSPMYIDFSYNSSTIRSSFCFFGEF